VDGAWPEAHLSLLSASKASSGVFLFKFDGLYVLFPRGRSFHESLQFLLSISYVWRVHGLPDDLPQVVQDVVVVRRLDKLLFICVNAHPLWVCVDRHMVTDRSAVVFFIVFGKFFKYFWAIV
jgi:hypothetical protein